MARKYSDYIHIADDFIPVYTEDKDRLHKGRWKSFYPHETFIELTSDMVSTLEGAKDEHKKPVWMRGSYGTGKTYAAFTIKHLFEESKDEVDSYFNKFNQLPAILKTKLENIKAKGKVFFVAKSSANITSENMLFYDISEAIRKELKAQGYSYFGQASQYDSIIASFSDEVFMAAFRKLFEKYQDDFMEFPDCNTLINKLSMMDPAAQTTSEIVTKIVDICNKESIVKFLSTPESLCAWIKDIRIGNNLQSIVFIWDEFTTFFRNNPTRTGGLQEIAHKAADIGFYFLLITHLSVSQFGLDQATAKVLEARFKHKQLEMANKTAYTFMAQSLNDNPNFAAEWQAEKSKLWQSVRSVAENDIFDTTEIDIEDIKKLLPMHPYSVYILKYLSERMSADQRTMYSYLTADPNEQNQKNFRWFINNNSVDEWRFLTADLLWDYFFDSDNVSSSDDLADRDKVNISHYNNFEKMCDNDDQRRVLKVVLMLDAMNFGTSKKAASSRRTGTSLLQATKKNIVNIFKGTKLSDEITFILSKLENKNIIGSIDNGNSEVLYTVRSSNVNQEQFNEIRRTVEREETFESIINNTDVNIIESFKVSENLKDRFFEIRTTYHNLKTKLEEASKTDRFNDDGIIPLVFVFAKNSNDAPEVQKLIESLKSKYTKDIVFINMSARPLGDDRYNEYIDKKTHLRYCMTTNDTSQAGIRRQDAVRTLQKWKNDLDATRMQITTNENNVVELLGSSNFLRELIIINKRLFPNAPEVHFSNASMFKQLGNKEDVPRMGMGIKDIISNYRYLEEIKNSLSKNGAWDVKGYENTKPDYFISQMKIAINKLIDESFANNDALSMLDILNVLRKKPFGLLDNVASGFILGFLLKDFADSGYYKRDGLKTPEPLTNEALANLIIASIVSPKKIENTVIKKRTEEQEKFCILSSKVFKLSKNIDTVEQACLEIKAWLTDSVNFPLWGLNYYVKNIEDKFGLNNTIIEIIKCYYRLVTINKGEGQDDNKLISSIVRLVASDHGVEKYLCEVVSKENVKVGLANYVCEINPEFVALVKKLRLEDVYLDNIRTKFVDYSWRWVEDDIRNSINEISTEYKL